MNIYYLVVGFAPDIQRVDAPGLNPQSRAIPASADYLERFKELLSRVSRYVFSGIEKITIRRNLADRATEGKN